jgi:hypothetical protein
MTNADEADDESVRDAACDPAEDGADDGFELEHDGQVYRLPGALQGGFLRQADYTRKTQELAEQRRALEAERAHAAAQAEAAHGALSDRAHLAALDRQLAGFQAIDWRALAQHDPARAQALQQQAHQTLALRDHYAQAVAQHTGRSRAEAAQEAAVRMAQTGRILSREINGWSPELAGKLVDYAQGHGVTLDELGAADDPRVWKILHRAWQGDQAGQREDAAKSAAQAQAVRPAVTVSGAAASGGGVRDELATKEWMKRRNEAVRKGR